MAACFCVILTWQRLYITSNIVPMALKVIFVCVCVCCCTSKWTRINGVGCLIIFRRLIMFNFSTPPPNRTDANLSVFTYQKHDVGEWTHQRKDPTISATFYLYFRQFSQYFCIVIWRTWKVVRTERTVAVARSTLTHCWKNRKRSNRVNWANLWRSCFLATLTNHCVASPAKRWKWKRLFRKYLTKNARTALSRTMNE